MRAIYNAAGTPVAITASDTVLGAVWVLPIGYAFGTQGATTQDPSRTVLYDAFGHVMGVDVKPIGGTMATFYLDKLALGVDPVAAVEADWINFYSGADFASGSVVNGVIRTSTPGINSLTTGVWGSAELIMPTTKAIRFRGKLTAGTGTIVISAGTLYTG